MLVRVAQGELVQRGPQLRITEPRARGPGLPGRGRRAAGHHPQDRADFAGGPTSEPGWADCLAGRGPRGMHASAPGGPSIVSPDLRSALARLEGARADRAVICAPRGR